MSIYRDSEVSCPRCGVALIDAGSARACNECHGLWLEQVVLHHMVEQMQTPPAPISLTFAKHERTPLSCPECSDAMTTLKLQDVEIDRCEKHGLWFDRDELQIVLLASYVVPE
jgi:Zn-finger nucleic acid-binding protein